MKKFLIVKTSSLGDIIHAFPIVSYLRGLYPDAIIDWVVDEHCKELVEAHPEISNVLCVRTKRWRKSFWRWEHLKEIYAFRSHLQNTHYDAVFDVQSNLKSSIITFLAHSSNKVGFGRKTVHEWPNLLVTNFKFDPPFGNNIRADNLYLVQQFLKQDPLPYTTPGLDLKISSEKHKWLELFINQLPTGRKILVCPGSAWPNKQLSEATLVQLLHHFAKQQPCHFLFAWGTQKELELVKRLQENFQGSSSILERVSLPLLQNLMGKMDLVVAMDSLPLHLAGTVGVATYSVFGASSAFKFVPQGRQHQTFQGKCPYGRQFEKRCPILRTCKTGACIRNLHLEDLIDLEKD